VAGVTMSDTHKRMQQARSCTSSCAASQNAFQRPMTVTCCIRITVYILSIFHCLQRTVIIEKGSGQTEYSSLLRYHSLHTFNLPLSTTNCNHRKRKWPDRIFKPSWICWTCRVINTNVFDVRGSSSFRT
jgi:hypothetical protein